MTELFVCVSGSWCLLLLVAFQVGREKMEDPFIFASVRVLGSWLAEETSSLKQEICDLLPFLIQYAKVLFEKERKGKSGLQHELEQAGQKPLWRGDALR